MTVVIEPAGPEDAAECATLIAEQLGADPVMRALVPITKDRTRRLAALHLAQLRSGPLLDGTVDVARVEAGGDVVGVAVWEAPGSGRHRWPRVRQLLPAVRAVGLRHLPRTAVQMSRYERHRPRRPHWYLAEIVVGASARGLGVGSELLRHRLAQIDLEQAPAYLEATTDGSRRLYERFGFRSLGLVPVAGPRPTAMLREPGAATVR
jgi:ribosomal protein S18 acetylase RimI-like enzyme